MPHQGPESHREPGAARSVAPARRDGTTYTSPRTAIWNALTALAIIVILFVTFYGLTTQRDPSTGAEGPTTAAAPTPSQTTGQGGSQSEVAPKGEGAR